MYRRDEEQTMTKPDSHRGTAFERSVENKYWGDKRLGLTILFVLNFALLSQSTGKHAIGYILVMYFL